jgi:lysozyme
MLNDREQLEAIDLAVPLIKQYEGFSARAYNCPAGRLTIGYGHCITSSDHIDVSISLSEWSATQILHADIGDVLLCLRDSIKDIELNANQIAALISFVFNIGCGNFKASTMLKLILANDFEGAAGQFDRWVHAGDKVLPGLVTRRRLEKELFLKPIQE